MPKYKVIRKSSDIYEHIIEADTPHEAGEKAMEDAFAGDIGTLKEGAGDNWIYDVYDITEEIGYVPDSPSLEDDSYYGTLIDIQNHELGGR